MEFHYFGVVQNIYSTITQEWLINVITTCKFNTMCQDCPLPLLSTWGCIAGCRGGDSSWQSAGTAGSRAVRMVPVSASLPPRPGFSILVWPNTGDALRPWEKPLTHCQYGDRQPGFITLETLHSTLCYTQHWKRYKNIVKWHSKGECHFCMLQYVLE